ncbi:hypothetical protein M514_21483 [Trichuris suis]|uniref:RNA-directed DNA polymerase n=1 Tax=Trichuris suis TaxID=68888 RepID=A0A085N9Q0_9BILA|nr:hypothetical protein M514_21483 [Trichuris suis]
MDTMLTGIPRAVSYLDDVIMTGTTDEEHYDTLEMVFSRLLEYGFRIRREKCKFYADEVEYLGHIVGATGLRADPRKTEAIVQMEPPTNVVKLRLFLGMVNFYAPFIPHLTEVAAPLNRLLRKGVPWTWDQAEILAFDGIKSMLSSSSLLAHYDPSLPITLAPDASTVCVGVVLYHRLQDDTIRVVAHASKAPNDAQRNYAQVEKEAFALVYTVKKFHKYIWGQRRSQDRGFAPDTLMNYSFKIEYRNTSDFGHADALSRLPLTSDELFNKNFDQEEAAGELMIRQLVVEVSRDLPVTAGQIADATKKDHTLTIVRHYVLSGWPMTNSDERLRPYFVKRAELNVFSGCLLWGVRTVIPSALRGIVLESLRKSHPGRGRMLSSARQFCWWPNMDAEVEELVRHCDACNVVQKNPPRCAPTPWPAAVSTWERVYADLAGPLDDRMYLLLVDSFSKWPEICLLERITSESVIDALKTIFSHHGVPLVLVMDNGRRFVSSEFALFCSSNGIWHVCTAPYMPQSNGQVERFVDTFKRALSKRVEGQTTRDCIREFLMMYRSTPHPTTECTPSEMLMKRRIRTVLVLMIPRGNEKVLRNRHRTEGGKPAPGKVSTFCVGQAVWVRDYTKPGHTWAKGSIVQRDGNVMYVVSVDGKWWRRHADQLRTVEKNVLPPSDRSSVFTDVRRSTRMRRAPKRWGDEAA